MTPHLEARLGDFAETVLLPGDPLRAQFIAESFLSNSKQVTGIRNMLGFTGEFEGKRISVMGSGMGIPSISIYATELINHYGVKNLIRVGSCGAIAPDIQLRDIIIGIGASTDSGVNRARFAGLDYAATADYTMLSATTKAAGELDIPVQVGNLFSADLFYHPDHTLFDTMEKMNILAVEMEAAGLYGVAAEYGAKALAICTVSDHIRRQEQLSPAERQSSFSEMIQIALRASLTI
ncbi:purine-nucleoside phosphorylase [Rubritalea squalenifaciens DSM 18772]|uniref:Uridine phosphorylase n=1 Tax=Rubritalea squalenifaciens DSM 18772 TaxID=1123071 RepID=A0A1M6DYF4_9BACT|nr:purine-nucleoside phosphorylase [Rubritalea squalenifaciens]SHI78221.1 purine-nucleoside phosphorylase [Rubritalea squalenifaciens DSM 18772]